MPDPVKQVNDDNLDPGDQNLNPDDPNLNDEHLDDENLNDENQISEADQAAIDLATQAGWQDKEAWVEAGGDENDWTSAKRFNQTKSIIDSNKSLRAETDRMKHDFDNRITGLQKFHQQALKTQIENLKRTRDEAAEDADMPAYKQANKDLEALESPVIEKTPPPNNQQEFIQRVIDAPETQAFIVANPWIKDGSAKGTHGLQVFTTWLETNKNNPDALLHEGLAMVKQSSEQAFPATNQNRNKVVTMGERNNKPNKLLKKHGVTMDSLSSDEMGIWNSTKSAWKDEAEFLQSVADSRKEV